MSSWNALAATLKSQPDPERCWLQREQKQSWQWPCSVINSFTQAQELSLPVCLPIAGQGLQGAEGRRVPALLMLGEIFVPEHSVISWTQTISLGRAERLGFSLSKWMCKQISVWAYGSISVDLYLCIYIYIFIFICAFLCTRCRASLPWVVPYSTQSCSDTQGCFSVFLWLRQDVQGANLLPRQALPHLPARAAPFLLCANCTRLWGEGDGWSCPLLWAWSS